MQSHNELFQIRVQSDMCVVALPLVRHLIDAVVSTSLVPFFTARKAVDPPLHKHHTSRSPLVVSPKTPSETFPPGLFALLLSCFLTILLQ